MGKVEFIPPNPSPDQPFALSDSSVIELKARTANPASNWGGVGVTGVILHIADSMPSGIRPEFVPYLAHGFSMQLGGMTLQGLAGEYASREQAATEKMEATA